MVARVVFLVAAKEPLRFHKDEAFFEPESFLAACSTTPSRWTSLTLLSSGTRRQGVQHEEASTSAAATGGRI